MSRKSGIVLVGVMGALALGLAALNLLVPPPQPIPKRQATAGSLIGSVVGQVEVRLAGKKAWRPAQVGQALVQGDEVRTGLFSEATLHLRGSSSVTVNPNTSFVVGQEQPRHSSFELGEGRIVAAIPVKTEREYRFRSRGSDAVAAVDKGEFAMASDGKGTVVVDAHKGSVKLQAKGKEVVISRGRRSTVLPDKPPSDVLPVPASVALQVRWPPVKSTRTQTKVTGVTEKAALVMVNGVQVRADSQGEFAVDVPLREGKNRLVVTVTDPSGKTTVRRSPEIRVDTRPPDLKVDAEGLWK